MIMIHTGSWSRWELRTIGGVLNADLMNDEDLMDRVAQPEAEAQAQADAFQTLYERHDEAMVRMLCRRRMFPGLPNREALIDRAAAEAWCKVWLYRSKWDRARASGGFCGWLRTITLRVIYDVLEDNDLGQELPGDEWQWEPPDNSVDIQTQLDAAEIMIASLRIARKAKGL